MAMTQCVPASRRHASPGRTQAGLAGRGEPPDIKALRQRIAELAKLSRIEYELIRNAEAEALGLRTSILDAEVAALHPSDTGPGLAFSDRGSWPDTVDGAVLLEELRGTIERYVVLPAHAAVAIALWTLHAWAYDAFYGSPYLLIRSPQKRCGKTTLLTVLRPLVRRPLIATSVSTSVIYRAIEQYQPTLVLDEVDAWMRENEEMRAVLCGGTTRSTARVLPSAAKTAMRSRHSRPSALRCSLVSVGWWTRSRTAPSS
jgi:putative DNA primase/helicase